MGDPAGVGAEIILGSMPLLPDDVQITIYGDMGTIREAAEALETRGLNPLSEADSGTYWEKELDLISLTALAPKERQFGKPSKLTGEAAYNFIISAAMAVMKGEADALVTAPISKQWINAAGHDFPGHTELLAKITKTDNYAMMLAGPSLKVVPVTAHIPLADVPGSLSADAITRAIELTGGHLIKWFGIERPKIACTGLNPHAGEGGKLGREETDIIEPAIEAAKSKGIDVTGPHPADAVFAKRHNFDAIVCMYHDQALGPLKALHFNDAVNITLGLPVVRTSPGHGTAFDIAGKGLARPESMLAAMMMAANIVRIQQEKPKITN